MAINGPFIVDLPIKVVIFHSFLYVYQRVPWEMMESLLPWSGVWVTLTSRIRHDTTVDSWLKNRAGWWYTYPSENYEFVSWDDDIPNIWENNPNAPNHQPEGIQHNCQFFRRN